MNDLAIPPLIGVETTAHYASELGCYLQALPTTAQLPLPGSHSLSIEELIYSTRKLYSALS